MGSVQGDRSLGPGRHRENNGREIRGVTGSLQRLIPASIRLLALLSSMIFASVSINEVYCHFASLSKF